MSNFDFVFEKGDNNMFIVYKSEIVNRFDPIHIRSMRAHSQKYLYRTERLSTIATSFSGGTPSKKEDSFWNGPISWASAKDFKSLIITETEDTITALGVKHSSTKIVPKNSFIMVVRSGILKHTLPTAVNLKEIAINQDIKAFVLRQDILPFYLNYFFYVFNKEILSLVVKHSKTVQSVNTYELDNLQIPIAPEDVQLQIISLMDKAINVLKCKEIEANKIYNSIDTYLAEELGISSERNRTIEDRKNGFLVQYRDITENRLDPIYYNADINKFTHCTYSKKLSSLTFSFINGFAVGRQDQVEEDDGILQIRPTNIDNNGRLKYDKNVYVPEMEDVPFVKSGVVLFNNTNSQEWVGKTAYFANEENRKVYTSNHITAIEVDRSKILPEYLCAILNMYQRHKVFYSICTNWNNQSGVGLDLLKSLHIPLFTNDRKESLRRQQEIVDRINVIYKESDECILSANQIMNEAKAKVESMIIGE